MKNMKALAATVLITAIVALSIIMVISAWQAMFPSGFDQACESLYNEYTATVDMATRDALFEEGMSNGCFHYN